MAHIIVLLSIILHPPQLVVVRWPEQLPPVTDLVVFPNLEMCEHQLDFLKIRQEYLYNTWINTPDKSLDGWYQNSIEDLNQRWYMWEGLAIAHTSLLPNGGLVQGLNHNRGVKNQYKYCPKEAQIELYNLRERLGYDDYYSGAMPVAVPIIYWWH